MKDAFVNELVNAAHMRLFDPDFDVVTTGYIILESLGLRLTSEEQEKEFQEYVDKINVEFKVRLKEIHAMYNHVRQKDERLWLERQRLKLMLKFCEGFFSKHLKTSEDAE